MSRITAITLFFLILTSHVSKSQTYVRFLTKYEIPIEDTIKNEFKFFELIQNFGSTRLTTRYLFDSTKLSERTSLFDSLGNDIGFRQKEYFESGKIKSIEIVDEQLGEKSLKKYYESGNLKSEIKSKGENLIYEKYLSQEGNEIPRLENRFPSPKGDLKGWYRYLTSTLKYPTEARSSKMEGTVILVFTIDKNGNILDPEVFNKGECHYSLEEEALRVILNYPFQFTPAIEDGELVEVIFKVPIRFQLS